MSKRVWLFGGNSKRFDHVSCLREMHQCYWFMQGLTFQENEIVYVYISSLQRVMFKTRVVEVDVEDNNPKKYFKKGYVPRPHCLKLELLDEYDGGLLGIDDLKKHGYKDSSLQKHNWKNTELIGYISECFDSVDFSDNNSSDKFDEARMKEVLTRRYERSSDARRGFLEKQSKPYKCSVCEMDFETIYGERGKEFIHVHHLDPLSSSTGIRGTHFADLAMVCPNCHAMLHRGDKLLTPDELRKEMISQKNK